MSAFVAGALVGALVGVVAGRWRGWGLGVSYGLVVAGAVWTAAGSIASNRAEEMAGIPYALGAGLAFWCVVAPAGIAAFALERRRARGQRDTR